MMEDIRDDAAPKVVTLYDASGQAVGAWCERTGRAMLGNAFYVRENAGMCTSTMTRVGAGSCAACNFTTR